MKPTKMRLDVGALEVESFQTASTSDSAGTVKGHEVTFAMDGCSAIGNCQDGSRFHKCYPYTQNPTDEDYTVITYCQCNNTNDGGYTCIYADCTNVNTAQSCYGQTNCWPCPSYGGPQNC